MNKTRSRGKPKPNLEIVKDDLIDALEQTVTDPLLKKRLNRATTLVLNSDYRPISVFPLKPLSWKDAIKNVWLEKFIILEEYPEIGLRSATKTFLLPSIVVNKTYQRHTNRVQFTRDNVFMRDNYTCQYCGHKFPPIGLTRDHVVPRALGGKTTWENIVTACIPCNSEKGDMAPHKFKSKLGLFRPLNMAVKPTYGFLEARFKDQPMVIPDERWNLYLQWTGPLWEHSPITGLNRQLNGEAEDNNDIEGF